MGPGCESVNPTASNESSLTCLLCDVVCSSTDAYAAHMRGLKHQRVGKKIFSVVSIKAASSVNYFAFVFTLF